MGLLGVSWVSPVCVHSGYDFGYLIKILSNGNLPEEEVDFFEILRLYFPVIYDVKYLMKSCKNLKVFRRWSWTECLMFYCFKYADLTLLWLSVFTVNSDPDWLTVLCFQGGLQEVAEQLELERIGPQHQAGSDSLLTGMAFFKMREVGPLSHKSPLAGNFIAGLSLYFCTSPLY